MKRVPSIVWLVAALVAAAMVALGLLWTTQQAKLAQQFQKLVEAQDPHQRIALGESMLAEFKLLPAPQRNAILAMVASGYGQTGQVEKMDSTYLAVIRGDPENYEALNNLAYEWARRGANLDSAAAFAQRAVRLSREKLPKNKPMGMSRESWQEMVRNAQGNYLDTYGWVLYQRGEHGRALEQLRQAAELAQDPTIEYHYGLALYQGGKIDEAIGRLATGVAGRIEDSAAARADLERIYREKFKSLKGLDQAVEAAGQKLASRRQEAMATEAAKLVGSAAPDFALDGLDGARHRLSDLRGKVVVLDFWATWCGPCRKSMPLVQKTHDAYRDRPVAIWGVNLEPREQLEQIRSFAAANRIGFPILLGGKMGNGLDVPYQVTGIPTTFVIDKQGVIRFRHIGYRENLDQLLAGNIEALLKE